MHFHPLGDEPGFTPAYCPDHMPDDVGLSECWGDCTCVVCEEEMPEVVAGEDVLGQPELVPGPGWPYGGSPLSRIESQL